MNLKFLQAIVANFEVRNYGVVATYNRSVSWIRPLHSLPLYQPAHSFWLRSRSIVGVHRKAGLKHSIAIHLLTMRTADCDKSVVCWDNSRITWYLDCCLMVSLPFNRNAQAEESHRYMEKNHTHAHTHTHTHTHKPLTGTHTHTHTYTRARARALAHKDALSLSLSHSQASKETTTWRRLQSKCVLSNFVVYFVCSAVLIIFVVVVICIVKIHCLLHKHALTSHFKVNCLGMILAYIHRVNVKQRPSMKRGYCFLVA